MQKKRKPTSSLITKLEKKESKEINNSEKVSECNKKLENVEKKCYGCIYRDFSERQKAEAKGIDFCGTCENHSNKQLPFLSQQKKVKSIFDINETETVSKIQREMRVGYHTASWLFDNCL